MIHAFANVVALVVLTVGVGVTLYTVGEHFDDIVAAILGRPVR
jgi:hypothetical protein